MIRVSFTYIAESGEEDPHDSTGLTVEAFEQLQSTLIDLGAEDIDIRRG